MFTLTDKQLILKEKARKLAASEFEPRAASIDITEAYPWDNVRTLKENGFIKHPLKY